MLGLNGAGKSSTFKMLTGALDPTSGQIEFAPKTMIGYCPQENCLDDLLTVKEILHVYSMIRGIAKNDYENVSPKFNISHSKLKWATIFAIK